MIKRFTYIITACVAIMAFTSCSTMKPGLTPPAPGMGTSTSQQDSGESQSLLGSLLSGLLGSTSKVTPEVIAGTWNYSSPECRFTSENALSQAGGAVAANTVEEKLASVYNSVGIRPGSCAFTFNKDNTCSVKFGGRTVNGTYTLDSENRDLVIMLQGGLLKLNAKVYYDYSALTILFDANKLLQIAQMVSAFTGQGSSTIQVAADLLQSYKGMMIGMNLKK